MKRASGNKLKRVVDYLENKGPLNTMEDAVLRQARARLNMKPKNLRIEQSKASVRLKKAEKAAKTNNTELEVSTYLDELDAAGRNWLLQDPGALQNPGIHWQGL